MAKMKHLNLFDYGDKAEVYAALQRDYDRDTWRHLLWHAVLGASALGAIYLAERPEWIWLFVGLYATERATARYADNSNRNWAMHVIDWMEHRDRSTR